MLTVVPDTDLPDAFCIYCIAFGCRIDPFLRKFAFLRTFKSLGNAKEAIYMLYTGETTTQELLFLATQTTFALPHSLPFTAPFVLRRDMPIIPTIYRLMRYSAKPTNDHYLVKDGVLQDPFPVPPSRTG